MAASARLIAVTLVVLSGIRPEGAELAGALQFRLRRLEAIRAAAEALVNRPRLGRDVFLRGLSEPVLPQGAPQWRASLYEFLCAHASLV
jgi:segregation and condensation protein A